MGVARRTLGSKAKRESTLVTEIIDGIHRRSDKKTKAWFTNYVKGTTWVGCKLPTVRQAVTEACSNNNGHDGSYLLHSAIELLQFDECDVKLSGMLLLSEKMPLDDLATEATLHRIEENILLRNCVQDWSSADWFATKVLRKIVFSGDHKLVERVLNYTKIADTPDQNYLFVRRCGVVSFLFYERNRDKLPSNIANKLIEACERNLTTSPEERFTQTGVAWVLRYVLLQPEEATVAMEMIIRNGHLWTTEAKKSLVEKLNKNDPRRNQILKLK